jgi:hypothetical protein
MTKTNNKRRTPYRRRIISLWFILRRFCRYPDLIAPNGRMISECWIGKGWEGSGRSWIETLLLNSPEGTEEKHEKPQDSWCPGRPAPECKCIALPLSQLARSTRMNSQNYNRQLVVWWAILTSRSRGRLWVPLLFLGPETDYLDFWVNSGIVPQIRTRPLPFVSFPVHCSVMIPTVHISRAPTRYGLVAGGSDVVSNATKKTSPARIVSSGRNYTPHILSAG